MSQFYDKASLVVVPSGYKAGTVYAQKPLTTDGQLAFTRTGDTATRVNSAGLIEKVRTNLLTYSQDLSNAAWKTVTNGGTITKTANAGTAPDGTNTASRLQIAGGGTYSLVYQDSVNPLGRVVISGYFKRYGGTNQTFRLFGDNGNAYSATFTATDTWQRFSFVMTASSTAADGLAADASNNAYDILVWGMQLETGDIATDYIPTTTAAVSVGPVANVPRLDYLGSTCPRLLLEPQRTNLATYSEQFNNTAWFKETGNSVTANTIASPDGYTNADTTTATSTNAININQSHTSASSSVHTFSIFLKKNNLSEIQVYIFSAGFLARAGVNLDNGTITDINGSGATITNYGNGWYRCSVQATINTGVGFTIGYLSASTTGSRSVYTYGAQLEVGAYATSYIPTLGAAVTRGADAASKTGISSLLSASEYTLFWEGSHIPTGQYNSFATFYNEANQNLSARFYRNNTNNELRAAIFNNAVGLSLDLGSGVTTQTAKCALRVKAGSYAFYVNGALVNSNTSALAPASTLDSVTIQYFNDTQSFDQKTGQVLFFKTGLTNAQLAELTTL